MSFEEAKKHAGKLNDHSSERNSTFASVEALEAVAETVKEARAATQMADERIRISLGNIMKLLVRLLKP